MLCLGRLERVKGFDIALDAFAQVTTARPDARLVIAGEGPEADALAAQASTLGIADRVELRGRVEPDAVPRLLDTASLVLMPSRDEGIPGVALEAALMRRPVIAARAGGLLDVVVEGETGLLVDREDPRALAAAALELLDDLPRAAALGEAAQRRVREHFGWQRFLERTLALYRRLARTAAPAGASDPSTSR